MTAEGSTNLRKPLLARRFVPGIVGTLLVAAIAATIALVIDNAALSLRHPDHPEGFNFSKVGWADVDAAHSFLTYSDVQAADPVRSCQTLMAARLQETVVNREVHALQQAGATCGTIRDSNSSKQWHFQAGPNGLMIGQGALPREAGKGLQANDCGHST